MDLPQSKWHVVFTNSPSQILKRLYKIFQIVQSKFDDVPVEIQNYFVVYSVHGQLIHPNEEGGLCNLCHWSPQP
jgi:hypothetical protein